MATIAGVSEQIRQVDPICHDPILDVRCKDLERGSVSAEGQDWTGHAGRAGSVPRTKLSAADAYADVFMFSGSVHGGVL